MELDELKNAWQDVSAPAKSATDIKAMLAEGNHPVLKGIREQIVIEASLWAAFLLCYYTMFDGHTKPVWVNAALVLSVLLPLLHNVMGYSFARYLVHGPSLKQSLTVYLAKVRAYATVSIASRVLFGAGLVFFFTYGLSFNTTRYYLMAIIGLVSLFQVWMLNRIWQGRIGRIKIGLQEFE